MADGTGLAAAIVGAGLTGRWHALAATRTGARIALVVDSDLTRARTLAAEFPGAEAAAHITALYGCGAKAVHVCSPLDTHVSYATAAISAGLSALVEKPLAPSAVTTAELLSLANRSRVTLCPVHQFLFQRGTLAALEELPELGRLVLFQAELFTAGADAGDMERNALVANVLPHPLSLIARFVKTPLSSAQWKTSRASDGELLAVSSMRDTAVAIAISTRGRPTANSVKLVGERGTIHLDLFHGFRTVDDGAVSRPRKISAPFRHSARSVAAAAANLAYRAGRRETAFPGLRELVARFYASVATGSAGPITESETLDVAVARDRILASVSMDS